MGLLFVATFIIALLVIEFINFVFCGITYLAFLGRGLIICLHIALSSCSCLLSTMLSSLPSSIVGCR